MFSNEKTIRMRGVPSPLKKLLPEFKKFETRMEDAIGMRFGIDASLFTGTVATRRAAGETPKPDQGVIARESARAVSGEVLGAVRIGAVTNPGGFITMSE